MGHRAIFKDRLVCKNGNIYRVIRAYWKKEKLDVACFDLKGNIYTRNLDFSYCGGWLYISPKDTKHSYYYHSNEPYGIEKWRKCYLKTCNIFCYEHATNEETEQVILNSNYKDFIYSYRALANKNPLSALEFLKLFIVNKKVEFLIKDKLYTLCTKKFLTMKESKQKELIAIAREHRNIQTFTDLLSYAKNPKLYDYLCKEQHETIEFYRDYLKLCKMLNKDITDNYWKYPKSLRDKHNELIKQKNEQIRVERELARLEEERKESELMKKIERVAKKFAELSYEIGDYQVAVASSLEDIKEQADTLSQCLITNGYHKKYADKEELLVFIKKGEERIATAEIFFDKARPLGQFYGNEIDRDNCIPNEEIKGVLDSWLNTKYLQSSFIA